MSLVPKIEDSFGRMGIGELLIRCFSNSTTAMGGGRLAGPMIILDGIIEGSDDLGLHAPVLHYGSQASIERIGQVSLADRSSKPSKEERYDQLVNIDY